MEEHLDSVIETLASARASALQGSYAAAESAYEISRACLARYSRGLADAHERERWFELREMVHEELRLVRTLQREHTTMDRVSAVAGVSSSRGNDDLGTAALPTRDEPSAAAFAGPWSVPPPPLIQRAPTSGHGRNNVAASGSWRRAAPLQLAAALTPPQTMGSHAISGRAVSSSAGARLGDGTGATSPVLSGDSTVPVAQRGGRQSNSTRSRRSGASLGDKPAVRQPSVATTGASIERVGSRRGHQVPHGSGRIGASSSSGGPVQAQQRLQRPASSTTSKRAMDAVVAGSGAAARGFTNRGVAPAALPKFSEVHSHSSDRELILAIEADMLSERPDTHFDDIAGLDAAKGLVQVR